MAEQKSGCLRICTICDSLYPVGTAECTECRDGGELIPLMPEAI